MQEVGGPMRWWWLDRVCEIENEDGIKGFSGAIVCLWCDRKCSHSMSFGVNQVKGVNMLSNVSCRKGIFEEFIEGAMVGPRDVGISYVVDITNDDDGVNVPCDVVCIGISRM